MDGIANAIRGGKRMWKKLNVKEVSIRIKAHHMINM